MLVIYRKSSIIQVSSLQHAAAYHESLSCMRRVVERRLELGSSLAVTWLAILWLSCEVVVAESGASLTTWSDGSARWVRASWKSASSLNISGVLGISVAFPEGSLA